MDGERDLDRKEVGVLEWLENEDVLGWLENEDVLE